MAKDEMVKLIAVKRFNHHDPGEKFEASEADAAKWVKEGWAKYAKEPPADKAVKGADVTK